MVVFGTAVLSTGASPPATAVTGFLSSGATRNGTRQPNVHWSKQGGLSSASGSTSLRPRPGSHREFFAPLLACGAPANEFKSRNMSFSVLELCAGGGGQALGLERA